MLSPRVDPAAAQSMLISSAPEPKRSPMLQPDHISLVGEAGIPQGTQWILREADSALERGDLIQAGARYLALAREVPDSGEAWLGVARVLLMTGQFNRATQLIDRTIAPEHKGQAWIELSHVLLRTGEFECAADLIDRAIALRPDDSRAHSLRALIARNIGNDEVELDAWKHAIQQSPNDPQLWAAFITVLERVSGAEAAIDYLERKREHVPKDISVDLCRARLYVSAGRLPEAHAHIRSILDAHPETSEAYSVQALLFLNAARHDDALASLESAIQHSPNDPYLWEAFITVLERVSGPQAAIDYLERKREHVPKEVTLELRSVHLYVSAGRLREAQSRLRRMIDAHPGNATLKAALQTLLSEQAHAALERGDLDQAAAGYMALIREMPDDAETWIGFCRVLLMRGEFDRATGLIDRTIPPEQKAKAWTALSHVLIRTGEFDRAADLLDRAIALDPTDWEAHSAQASVFRNTGNPQGELDALKRAIQHSSNNPEPWEGLITALRRKSGAEAVIDYLERQHEDVPKTLSIELLTVQLYASTGQIEKVDPILAQRRLRSMLEASPECIAENVAFARFLADIGEEHAGIEILRILTRHHKNAAGPFIALADLLEGEGTNIPEAMTSLRRAIALRPHDVSLIRKLSRWCERDGRYDEAADLLRSAIEGSGGASADDYFRLGTILQNAGIVTEGKRYFEQARARVSEEIEEAAGDIHQKL